MFRPKLEVADIFRDHGAAWRSANAGHVSLGQLKVMTAIERCRTAALGGHVERCENCTHTVIAYNSCRNRHCPKCQGAAAQEWLAEREAELLPVPYFHVVFTLPAAIADIAYQNKAVIYDLLFKASSQTMLTIAADPKHLGARIGILSVLHTWGSARQLWQARVGRRRGPAVRNRTGNTCLASRRMLARLASGAAGRRYCGTACNGHSGIRIHWCPNTSRVGQALPSSDRDLAGRSTSAPSALGGDVHRPRLDHLAPFHLAASVYQVRSTTKVHELEENRCGSRFLDSRGSVFAAKEASKLNTHFAHNASVGTCTGATSTPLQR
jgi:hypothetical protein